VECTGTKRGGGLGVNQGLVFPWEVWPVPLRGVPGPPVGMFTIEDANPLTTKKWCIDVN